MPGIKLDVGGGRNPEPGYKILDVVAGPNVDYVCEAWDTPLGIESVASLRARHFLEHLTLHDAHRVLTEWHRILVPDGALNITVPNLLFHVKQLTMSGRSAYVPHSNFDHAMAGFYGWQGKGEDEMTHRWGYTPTTLLALFKRRHFDAVIMPSRECDIVLHGRKPE